jgi:hypothetical protein
LTAFLYTECRSQAASVKHDQDKLSKNQTIADLKDSSVKLSLGTNPPVPGHTAHDTDAQSIDSSYSKRQGGRLWKLAVVQEAGSDPHSPLNIDFDSLPRRGPGARFAETFIERTRSRAVPDAPFDTSINQKKKYLNGTVRMSGDTRAILMNTGLAHKRVRVVQLLIIGLVGLLLGWLGNFFVGSSCHFASVDVKVGQYSNSFPLHFGLWKYSPADSALAGYTYCYPYSGQHESDGPVVARVLNVSALMTGTYSLVVLWWYLISGRANGRFWRWAVRTAILAGVCQIAVLLFFVGSLCRSSTCHFGPASFLAFITSVAWFILGFELHYNMPTVEEASIKEDVAIVANLEMTDLQVASREFIERAFRSSPRGQYLPPDIA